MKWTAVLLGLLVVSAALLGSRVLALRRATFLDAIALSLPLPPRTQALTRIAHGSCAQPSRASRTHAQVRACVVRMCEAAFGGDGELAAGCAWLGGWYEGADVPRIRYRQVACPEQLRRRAGFAA